MQSLRKVVIDPFCFRQFNPSNRTSSQIPCSKAEFEDHVNSIYNRNDLKEGYAPFCQHLFVKNWTTAVDAILPITQENAHLLVSEYEARTEKELPVLVRYFPVEAFPKLPVAAYLDIILYSKEQIQAENGAQGTEDPHHALDYDYGVVSVKPQGWQLDSEIPMNPITMMRNSLGKEEGGSGVPLDREKYLLSVQFWQKHALVK